ncbi:pectinesterase/pectinesterase inhibitor PPE8B-like [Prunus dulcis]|uniref:pectinesterase/pectinesterase inhibitor PPE8B-like n=1 Tax=Prunus dulcis TaxID=3755 RepID=UPI001482232D|nr:pectinesterase/pectinesterase inhibitor PPE8B-like [Prunus dulcis]
MSWGQKKATWPITQVSHAYDQSLDAIAAAPSHSQKQFVIFVKKGVYKEYAKIDKTKTNLVLIGEGMSVTTISGDRSNASGWATMKSATFDVRAQGFIAMDIGFENTAGPNNRQAVALSVGGDQKNIKDQQNTLTASGRFAEDSTGFSLEYCSIEADFDLAADVNSTPTYLGRPWGKYARTEFMKSSMSNVIRPEGLLSGMGNLL